MGDASTTTSSMTSHSSFKPKLHGRAFYESIGSPRMIIAPMVDRSEFAWRLLTKSYMDDGAQKSLLAYTPMLHARLFKAQAKFRDHHFQPVRESLKSIERSPLPTYLDGNPATDRPLFVQFCANNPDDLLEAARYVAPYCDAVDLNLGCPQGIARSGNYGAFLQEDWNTIYALINKLHTELSVPVTAKMRILDTKERTLEYAKMILSAGASILTVHGRRREQKAQNMGLANWPMIRYLRDNLPPETVIFANGNILNYSDIQPCLEATGADAVMSAEGNLSDPTVFANPDSALRDEREYWRGSNGMEGYRIDGVIRRYLDIIYRHVLDRDPPRRPPLYVSSDTSSVNNTISPDLLESQDMPHKKRRRDFSSSPNLRFMQGHMFQLLRPMLATHEDIRNALTQCRVGDMPAYERVLQMVEDSTRQALQGEVEEATIPAQAVDYNSSQNNAVDEAGDLRSAAGRTMSSYKRPWWVCQPHIRPLPIDMATNGSAIPNNKVAKAIQEQEREEAEQLRRDNVSPPIQRSDSVAETDDPRTQHREDELPKEALVCG